MELWFTKGPANAGADTLRAQRANGVTVTLDLPRQGVLPRLAVHYVVESTLGWADGVFGLLASEQPYTLNGAGVPQSPTPRMRSVGPDRMTQAAAVVECLEMEQWSGSSPFEQFLERLRNTCAQYPVDPPRLFPEQVTQLRTNLRSFGAAWRPLLPGQWLHRKFPA